MTDFESLARDVIAKFRARGHAMIQVGTYRIEVSISHGWALDHASKDEAPAEVRVNWPGIGAQGWLATSAFAAELTQAGLLALEIERQLARA